MKNQTPFLNKKILITGGSSGLGRSLALQLAAAGARVAIVGRGAERLHKVAKESANIKAIQADVSDKKQIYPIAGQAQAWLGEIDILINAASDLGPTTLRLLADTECEDFEHVLQTNLLGPFRLIKAILGDMMVRSSGLVVNISSDAAVSTYPRWGAYSVSKAALDHLTRIFDEELKSNGVRFLTIDPGDMRTPMHFQAVPDADPEKLRDPDVAAQLIMDLIGRNDFSMVRRSV